MAVVEPRQPPGAGSNTRVSLSPGAMRELRRSSIATRGSEAITDDKTGLARE